MGETLVAVAEVSEVAAENGERSDLCLACADAPSERERLLKLEEELGQRVIGQRLAVTAVANAVRRSRAGLGDPNRPTGAFIWTAAGGTRELPDEVNTPYGINDAGGVVGQAQFCGTTRCWTHAFLWTEERGVEDLGDLVGASDADDKVESVAYSIDNLGRVVGESQNATGETRAFLWTREGGMVDIGSVGGAGGSSASMWRNKRVWSRAVICAFSLSAVKSFDWHTLMICRSSASTLATAL